MAAWHPALLPIKDVDYFGSKKLPLSDFYMPGWLQRCYGRFPDFFSALSWAFFFMLHFLCFDLLVVTPTLACKAALFGDPAVMHPLSTSCLAMLVAEGFAFLPATRVLLLCSKEAIICFFIEQCMCVRGEGERESKSERGRRSVL